MSDDAPNGRPDEANEDAADRLEEVLADHREATGDNEPEEDDVAPDPYDPFAALPDPEDTEPGDQLPDAPLFALLRTLEAELTPRRIDRVWIFPPRRIEVGETAVVVVGAFTETDPERRRVYAAHYTALDDADKSRLALDEYGTAPTDRVGRLVEDVLERIKDGPTGAPRPVRIEGLEQRWLEMLHDLAERHLEERRRSPRLR